MIPFWPTQSWFPAVLKLIVATPIIGGKPETPPIPTTETGGFSLVEG